ncbi:hypothetical protein EVAR_46935_1 [Eumeta japonica]|uniref:Uncharacterized protein n=1 Tax=Eumeta variegata TaxID=151549 RepID=A0A4C2A1R3_EUMVA|nr:hypothetical protein EVAR_46935_1 [Eumeta japonica]
MRRREAYRAVIVMKAAKCDRRQLLCPLALKFALLHSNMNELSGDVISVYAIDTYPLLNDSNRQWCSERDMWSTWLQHQNERAKSVKYPILTEYRCEVAVSAFIFRLVSENSGGAFSFLQ